MMKPKPKQSPIMIAAIWILSLAAIGGFVYAKVRWPSPPHPQAYSTAESAQDTSAGVDSAAADTGARWSLNDFKEPITWDVEDYDRLLEPRRLQSCVPYGVSEFSEMMSRLGLKDGENAALLKCRVKHDSTVSGDEWRALQINSQLSWGWEMWYFRSINQTWIVASRLGNDGRETKTILKVARGKRPDLNVI